MAERVAEIYSLLVPLAEGRLIIPRSCVAEVIGFQTPSEMTGAPPWYVGTVPWNGKAVPLVSVEGACGQAIPPASGRTRIVILHALGTRVEGGNFALLSPGATQRIEDVPRPARGATVLIGPEGGLSDAEQNAARTAGFTAVNLGPRVLRTETAAIAALTLLQREFGDL